MRKFVHAFSTWEGHEGNVASGQMVTFGVENHYGPGEIVGLSGPKTTWDSFKVKTIRLFGGRRVCDGPISPLLDVPFSFYPSGNLRFPSKNPFVFSIGARFEVDVWNRTGWMVTFEAALEIG